MPAQRALALAFLTAVAAAALTAAFYLWTILYPLAPALAPGQVRLVSSLPILAGAAGCVLLGALSDRYGGSRVLTVALLGLAVPTLMLATGTSLPLLMTAGLLLGLGGALFPAGVSAVAGRAEPLHRGLALGLYGMGTAGVALTAVPGPARFWAWAVTLVLLAALVTVAGRTRPQRPAEAAGGKAVWRDSRAWLLGFCYFITFGGFAAFAGYLGALYSVSFGPNGPAATNLTLTFALVAALARPLGGWLADRNGGKQVAAISLLSVAALGALLTLALPRGPFQAVMLLLGVAFGLGSGAVFQLVAQYFPARLGAAAGLVGGIGALGSLLPILIMDALADRLGTYTPAFALLAAVAALAWLAVNTLEEPVVPWQRPRETAALIHLERLFAGRAAMNTFIVTVVLAVLVYVGTGQLYHFDPALYGYAIATVVAIIGITLRLTAWLMRPATRTLTRHSLARLFRRVKRQPGVTNPVPQGVGRWFEGRRHPGGYLEALDRLPKSRGGLHLPPTRGGDPGLAPAEREGHSGLPGPAVAAKTLGANILTNQFIFRRSLWRGTQHFLLMWGILGAFGITIPLTFGWLHFEAVGQTAYAVVAFGLPLFSMPVHGLLAGLIYHGLSLSAVLTLAGAAMMLLRRLVDKDAKVDQRVEYDLFPLYLILAVTVTGLALTVSHMWGGGWGYPAISVIHEITVVFLLLYLPFGKLFHIPMRLLAVGADVYHEVSAHEGLVACARCQKVYATRRQIQDVIAVLKESGMALMAADGKTYLAEYCPECRRVIRGLVYARRELRPEEIGSPHPIATVPMEEAPPFA